MNPYKYEATCEVCGGQGVSRTPYWFQRHVDPRICQAVLVGRAMERRAQKRARRQPDKDES
jgi:hypothetical protein